ncbi:MAG: hypothetical protein KDK30_09420 [Leptospiraceae bacterium]|nr:hypothetical protein [Leptospiraceae bacterium]
MALMLKFVGGFAIVGLLLSVVFGILGGNRIVPLVVTAVVCSLLSGGLGAGTYKILEQRVPEFLDLLRGEGGMDSADSGSLDLSLDDDGEEGEYEADVEEGAAAAADQGAESKSFGDHIIVDKIKIKNEPKLMAEAIRTMLSKDDS